MESFPLSPETGQSWMLKRNFGKSDVVDGGIWKDTKHHPQYLLGTSQSLTKVPRYYHLSGRCSSCWREEMTQARIQRTCNRPFTSSTGLCVKTRLCAQPLIWKWFFTLMQIKLIFTRKVVHLASFWKWGFFELGSGLFATLETWRKLGRVNIARTSGTVTRDREKIDQ